MICANRADGLVARAGSAVKLAASGRGGMARGLGCTDFAGALAAADFVFAAGALAAGRLASGLVLAAGAAFLATGADAFFAGAFLGVFAAAFSTGFAADFLAGALAAGLLGFAAGLALDADFAGCDGDLALADALPAFALTLG